MLVAVGSSLSVAAGPAHLLGPPRCRSALVVDLHCATPPPAAVCVQHGVTVHVFRSYHSQPHAPGLEASAVTAAVGRDPPFLLSPADLLLLKPSRLPLCHPPLLSFSLCSCPCPRCSSLKMALRSLCLPSSGISSDVPFSVSPAHTFKIPTALGFLMPAPTAFSLLILPNVRPALDCISRAYCWGHWTGV